MEIVPVCNKLYCIWSSAYSHNKIFNEHKTATQTTEIVFSILMSLINSISSTNAEKVHLSSELEQTKMMHSTIFEAFIEQCVTFKIYSM